LTTGGGGMLVELWVMFTAFPTTGEGHDIHMNFPFLSRPGL